MTLDMDRAAAAGRRRMDASLSPTVSPGRREGAPLSPSAAGKEVRGVGWLHHGPLRRVWPALILLILLTWGWQAINFGSSIPYYGDTLEFMWVWSWYGEAFRTGQSIAVHPLAFAPAGWRYSANLIMLVSLLPLVWIGGPAFAYNVTTLLTFIAAFAGGYLLARRAVGPLAATAAAVLVAFVGARWFHHIGHLNILIGSAMLPWVLLALDRWLAARARRWRWLVAAGVLWAASMSGSLYFAYLSGLAVAAWTVGYLATGGIRWRTGLVALVVPAAVALTLAMPNAIWLWKNSTETGVRFYSAGDVNFWGASLNALPLPALDHPWFGGWARSIYRGLPFEQGATNLGLIASFLAASGAALAIARKRWWPALFLAVAGVTLSLGLTLKWDNEPLHWEALRPINAALWTALYRLKPSFFAVGLPPPPFDTAVPLPGMLAAALVPFLERARVFARFALVGSIGMALLIALAIQRVRHTGLAVLLAALLIVEVIPPPLAARPFPPQPHAAFTWLQAQEAQGQTVADFVAGHRYTPVLYNEGESVWATRVHGWPALAGTTGIWPAHTMFLFQWLATHEHAFWHPDLAPILRFFRVRYVLLHMRGEWEHEILAEANQNPEFTAVGCFDPPTDRGPWPYPICVMELMPPLHPNVNLIPEEGWSGAEPWGVWAEGTMSQAYWVATEQGPQVLSVEAFPLCVEGRNQSITIEVNGQRVADYRWTACEPWSVQVTLAPPLVRLGQNVVVVRSAYAARPSDVSGGKNSDTRPLSVGFPKLRIDAAHVEQTDNLSYRSPARTKLS